MKPLPLIEATFDRASHVKETPDYCLHMLDKAETRLLPTKSGQIALSRSGMANAALGLLTPSDAGPLAQADRMIWLGRWQDQAIFGLMLEDEEPADSLDLVPVREAMLSLPADQAQIVASLATLSQFHRNHRFCGRCGSPLEIADAGLRRDCTDTECSFVAFPRSDPAIIVLLHDGADHCLLGRSARLPPGVLSTLAGFVEPGETLEQAVIREMREESGLPACNPRYIASQPWPFPHSLMLGFIAEVPHQTPQAEDEEIEELRWVHRDQILTSGEERGFYLPPKLTIARHMIEGWAKNQL
ncbi:MAG: NAD(+) diphosphatase [Alphaproteobacteria bacterium]